MSRASRRFRPPYLALREPTPQLQTSPLWSRATFPRHGQLRHESPLPYITRCGSRRQYSTPAAVLGNIPDTKEHSTISRALSDQKTLVRPVSAGDFFSQAPLVDGEAIEDSIVDGRQPVPISLEYGKWQYLAFNHERLAFESDFRSSDGKELRLVDSPENENDIDLWACLLDFRRRLDGAQGVLSVWLGVLSRRQLHQTTGPTARAFWQTVLNEALHNDRFLESVLQYAEWLYETHGVRWPNIYDTIVSFFVSSRQHGDALRWHLRLSPNFDVGQQYFVTFVQNFITDEDPAVQDILRDIYITSTHRQLYDHIVPFLYAQGFSALARSWRKLLVVYNDVPVTFSARPFLRFLTSYYPTDSMVKGETLAAGLEVDGGEDRLRQRFRQYMDRVHPEAFYITEKLYRDEFGARWFANSWASLDLAIQVVWAFGLGEIGPLSLRSIALRESDGDGIRQRLNQLKQFKISVGPSSYAMAVKHFAEVRDYENLLDLIRSDLQPDVFDDPKIQQIMKSCLSTGNLKLYRLILAIRLAASLKAVALLSNRLLKICLAVGNKRMLLTMLDDMIASGIDVFPSIVHDISRNILSRVSVHREDGPVDLDFHLALYRRMTALGFPPPARALQTILYRLGREGRLADMEQFSLEILQHYAHYQASNTTTMNIHRSDLPELLREEPPHMIFQTLPRDFPPRHHQHPVQLIFDAKLQSSIIRWGFRWAFSRPRGADMFASQPSDPPERFHFARGIRLLALLRDQGVYVPGQHVRKAVVLRLAELYGAEESLKPGVGSARSRNQLTLEEAKLLCDMAYGSELLPMEALVEAVSKKGSM